MKHNVLLALLYYGIYSLDCKQHYRLAQQNLPYFRHNVLLKPGSSFWFITISLFVKVKFLVNDLLKKVAFKLQKINWQLQKVFDAERKSHVLLCCSIPQLSVSGSSPQHSRQSVSPNLTVKSEPMSPRHPGNNHHGVDSLHNLVRSHTNHLSPASLNTGTVFNQSIYLALLNKSEG